MTMWLSRLRSFLRLGVIGAYPNNIQNGQVEDAIPVMANFNYILAQVNALVVFEPLVAPIDTAFGYLALNALTTGIRNTAFGYNALPLMTTAQSNTAIGHNALASDIVGSFNTAVGSFAANSTTGANNIAVGFIALFSNAGGNDNVAIGVGALGTETAASLCVAIGSNALALATTGSQTAVGNASCAGITTGTRNVGLGQGTLGLGGTTASLNTCIGTAAGAWLNGNNNIAIGDSSMFGTGAAYVVNDCVAIGVFALETPTGSSNTAVGKAALFANTSGANNTAIGFGALSALTTFSNCTGLGSLTAVTASNQVQLGDASTTTFAYGAVQNRSDVRDKADIHDTELGLDFINALRPRAFKWAYRERNGKVGRRQHQGLVAQEVEDVMRKMGVDFGGLQHHAISGGHDVYSIGYTELIGPLIKAVQELAARVLELEGRGA
jgi:hypothetical protein